MSPGPVKRYRARSRNRALGNQQRTELREKALEMAQRGLRPRAGQKTVETRSDLGRAHNRRGGPVDKDSPGEQQAAARRYDRGVAEGIAQREKQIDQIEGRRSFQLHKNTTSNERSGQLFRTIKRKGGEVHEYQSGKRVFVRKPAASRTTGATEGTYNRHKPASRGSQDLANQLAQRRVTENRPKARRKLFARG
jgi:hypothetical protein